jgi:hypothetical protein
VYLFFFFFFWNIPNIDKTLRLTPLAASDLTENSADLHRLILPDAYNHIAIYEMAIGADAKLDNLATADSTNYELQGSSNPVVFHKGGEHPIRFFILGCVTACSAFHFRMVNGCHSINIMPSALGWGRASGVISAIFGGVELKAYVFNGGLSFSTTVAQKSSTFFPSIFSFHCASSLMFGQI